MCQLGTYAPSVGYVACIDCPQNFMCSHAVATACPDNMYSEAGDGYCKYFDANMYDNSRNTCNAGTFKARGRDTCTACPIGHYCAGNTQLLPAKCLPGTYQGSTGQTSCSSCSSGYYSRFGEKECHICPKGHMCSTTATLPQICPRGTYAAAGSTLAQHARMDISVSQDRLRLLLPILCVLLDSIALTQAPLSLYLLALAEPTHLQLARLQTLVLYAVLDTSVLLVLLRWNLALQEPTALEATPTTFLERVAMESINRIS